MFRPRQEFTDPFLALQEVKLSQIIIKELIEREYILDQTAKILAGGKFVSQLAAHRESGNSYSNSNRNSLNRNSINRNSNGKLKLGVPPPLPPPRVKLDARKDLTAEALQKLEAVELQELAESFSPQMMARMVNGRTKSLKNHKESVATDEEETNHEDEHEIFKDVSSDD